MHFGNGGIALLVENNLNTFRQILLAAINNNLLWPRLLSRFVLSRIQTRHSYRYLKLESKILSLDAPKSDAPKNLPVLLLVRPPAH